jgi:signal transduction histidine kinase
LGEDDPLLSLALGLAGDSRSQRLLETVDTQSQTLSRFVNHLLDLSRISRGLIEIRPERFDFVSVARDAVHALEPFIDERQRLLSLVLCGSNVRPRGSEAIASGRQ